MLLRAGEQHASTPIGAAIARTVRNRETFQTSLNTIANSVFDKQGIGAKDAVLTIAFLLVTTTVSLQSKILAIELLEHLCNVDSEHCGKRVSKCGVLDLLTSIAENDKEVLTSIVAARERKSDRDLKPLVEAAGQFMANWIQSQGTDHKVSTVNPPTFESTAVQGRRRSGSAPETLESRLANAQDLCRTMVETIEGRPGPDSQSGLVELRTALNELHETFQMEASKAVDEERMADFSRISRVVDELNQAVELHNKFTSEEENRSRGSDARQSNKSWFGGSLGWEAPAVPWGADLWTPDPAPPPGGRTKKKSRKSKKTTPTDDAENFTADPPGRENSLFPQSASFPQVTTVPASFTQAATFPQQQVSSTQPATFPQQASVPEQNSFAAPQQNSFSAPQQNSFSALQQNSFAAPQQNSFSALQQNSLSAPQQSSFSAPQHNSLSASQQNSLSAPQPLSEPDPFLNSQPSFNFYSVAGEGTGAVPPVPTNQVTQRDLDRVKEELKNSQKKVEQLESKIQKQKDEIQRLNHELDTQKEVVREAKKAAEHAKQMWMRESVRASSLNDNLKERLEALEARDEAIRSLQESEAQLLRKVNQLQLLSCGDEPAEQETSAASMSPLAFDDRVKVRPRNSLDTPLLSEWTDRDNQEKFRHLLWRDDGLLYVRPGILEVGLRLSFEGPRCTFRIYYGNLSPGTLEDFSVQLKTFSLLDRPEPDANFDWRASPVPPALAQGQQVCQSVVATCTGPYTFIPMASVRFLLPDATPLHLVVRIPLPVTKFIVPHRLTATKFFNRWRSAELVLNETTASVTVDPSLLQPLSKLTEVLQLGGSLEMHVGLDADPNNLVLVGTFPPPGDPSLPLYLVMVRFEIVDRSLGKARIAVRSDSPQLSQTTRATLLAVCTV